MDWDDLRLFLAVARSGSMSGAARKLAVNHSTVSRRLAAFEERLGVRLFERLPNGLATTEAGDRMAETAGRMEREVEALDRMVHGRDTRLCGSLRVAVSDLWGIWCLPIFGDFAQAYPEVELEIVAANEPTNLSKREADVAIRVTDAPPEHLVGRKTARIASAVYGSRAYLERHPLQGDLRGHRWLGWDQTLGVRDLEPWLREIDPAAHVACRVTSGEMMLRSLRAGLGLAKMVCAMGDPEPELQRLTEPEIGRPLWLLTHPDLRRTARVRTFLDFVAERVAEQRPLIEGRRG